MPARRVKPWERRRCAQACGNCKRRKERCDGQLPCGRCSTRGVVDQCSFTRSPRTLNSPGSCLDYLSNGDGDLDLDHLLDSAPVDMLPSDDHTDALSPHDSEGPRNVLALQAEPSIHNGHPTAISISDSANLSFLQVVRHLVRDSLGPCVFAQDAPDSILAETTTPVQPDCVLDVTKQPPQKPEPSDAWYLVRWYLRATNCILSLFDELDLHNTLSQWLQTPMSQQKQQAVTPVFFLIFAIGSQTCPENRDDDAERYFNYGRFLIVSQNIENSSISTVHAYVLITMYLLGASRRDAAFMYLGIAVRAGYALGVHRNDINAEYDFSDYAVRERLWKVLRVLDLFMSASLGHHPSTCETRDTAAEANYSASNDLCVIFESILTDVYSRRKVSKDALGRISEHHRQWTKRFTTGLAADDVKSTEFIDTDEGKRTPNIGLYHIKEAYYWTIMLLTRPYLVETMSRHVSKTTANDNHGEHAITKSSLDGIVSYACIDSAVRTVDLLSGLRSSEDIPKRLPFIVNSLFVASLVLGLAQFGDLDCIFPLGKSLARARKLLVIFSRCDAGSKRNLAIVDDLRASCGLYLEKRFRRKMERQSLLIGGLFGMVHDNVIPQPSLAGGEADQEAQEFSVQFELRPAPVTGTEETCNTGHRDSTSSAGSEAQGYLNLGVEGMVPDFATMTNLALPLSPRSFLSDSHDKEALLVSGPLASALHFGDMLVDESAMIGLGNQDNWPN